MRPAFRLLLPGTKMLGRLLEASASGLAKRALSTYAVTFEAQRLPQQNPGARSRPALRLRTRATTLFWACSQISVVTWLETGGSRLPSDSPCSREDLAALSTACFGKSVTCSTSVPLTALANAMMRSVMVGPSSVVSGVAPPGIMSVWPVVETGLPTLMTACDDGLTMPPP